MRRSRRCPTRANLPMSLFETWSTSSSTWTAWAPTARSSISRTLRRHTAALTWFEQGHRGLARAEPALRWADDYMKGASSSTTPMSWLADGSLGVYHFEFRADRRDIRRSRPLPTRRRSWRRACRCWRTTSPTTRFRGRCVGGSISYSGPSTTSPASGCAVGGGHLPRRGLHLPQPRRRGTASCGSCRWRSVPIPVMW